MAIYGPGFLTNNIENNEVNVCGIPAKVKEATETQITVEVPALVTKVAHSLYNLGEEKKIQGTPFADTNLKKEKAFDKFTNTIYESDNDNCYVGLDVKAGMFVSINKIRYIPNPEWAVAASYLEGAMIQGSNDNQTWSLIFEVDINNVHSGWNYWEKQSGTTHEYRYIRFKHDSTSRCEIAEL